MKSAVRSPAFRPQASDADPFRDAKPFRLKAGLRTDFPQEIDMSKLEKEVRFLKVYAVVYAVAMTLLFGVLALSAFRQADQRMKFTEIDVERLNIIEKHDN